MKKYLKTKKRTLKKVRFLYLIRKLHRFHFETHTFDYFQDRFNRIH